MREKPLLSSHAPLPLVKMITNTKEMKRNTDTWKIWNVHRKDLHVCGFVFLLSWRVKLGGSNEDTEQKRGKYLNAASYISRTRGCMSIALAHSSCPKHWPDWSRVPYKTLSLCVTCTQIRNKITVSAIHLVAGCPAQHQQLHFCRTLD